MVTLEVYLAALNRNGFGLEQFSLLCCDRLSDQKPPTGANHAMPRDSPAGGTRGHGVADHPRPAPQLERSRKFAVRRHAPARDLLHQAIDRVPGRFSRYLQWNTATSCITFTPR